MSGLVVVDASLAFKWIVSEPYSDAATTKLEEWVGSRTRLLAPGLMAFEVANALHKRVLSAELDAEQAELLLVASLTSGPELDHGNEVHVRALQIARRFRRPSSYDAHYLALAEREGCECWTADERLWNAVGRDLPGVRWIGETLAAAEGAAPVSL